MNIRVNLRLPCAIPFASRYVTKTRGEIYASSWINNLSTMQVTSLSVLFSLLVSVFRHPCDQITLMSGQTMMDTVTPRGPENISPTSEEQIPILSYQVTD